MDILTGEKEIHAGSGLETGPASPDNADEESDDLRITERDVSIFRMIHEQKYLAYGQIRDAFWKGCSERASAGYHRTEKLIESGYLKKEMHKELNLWLYLITEKAHGLLKEKEMDLGLDLFRFNDFYLQNTWHDLCVTNIRILFRELGADSWECERMLKERDYRFHTPDGLLRLYGHEVAVEIENTTKSTKRYLELFDFYKRNPNIRLVLMIITKEVKNSVINLNYDPRLIWFVNYKDLLKKREYAVFKNSKGEFILTRIL